MSYQLFTKGFFYFKEKNIDEAGKETIVQRNGLLNELEGILSFIDSLDKFNHLVKKPKPQLESKKVKAGRYFDHLNIREKTYSKFLFYRYFIANEQPTILCEGKTDNIYMKAAISRLFQLFPKLGGVAEEGTKYKPFIHFLNFNSKSKYLLDLGGGASFFKRFIEHYDKDYERYQGKIPQNPVILLLDNDKGPSELIQLLVSKKFSNCPEKNEDIRKKEYLHITKNVYLILTPLANGHHTAMEDFFDKETLDKNLGGKSFNPKNDMDTKTHFGKHVFSTKIVRENKENISFDLFKPILKALSDVIEDYKEKIKPTL